MTSVRASKRIQKELERFYQEAEQDGLKIDVIEPNVWHVTFTCVPPSIYADETYTLKVRFTDEYPMDSPEVVFLLPSPVHEHCYSNGHICLNILGEDWSPALTAKSVCLSIISMLSSAAEKKYPDDNTQYTRVPRGNPKHTNFVYHDDGV